MQACVEIRSYPPEIGRHRHDFHQLILPCHGAMELETGLGNGRVGPAVAAFIPAGESHSFCPTPDSRFVVLDLPAPAATALPQRPFFAVDPALRGLVDYFIAAPAAPHLHGAWLALLMDRLAQPQPSDEATDLAGQQLRRALAVMRARLDQPLRVEDIASAAGISTSGLHRLMRDRLRTTPQARLLALRLDRAEALLAQGHMPIAQIALATGFADQSALTRAMRRERGITPARLRQQLAAALTGSA